MSHNLLKTIDYRLKATLLSHCIFGLHLTFGLVLGLKKKHGEPEDAYV